MEKKRIFNKNWKINQINFFSIVLLLSISLMFFFKKNIIEFEKRSSIYTLSSFNPSVLIILIIILIFSIVALMIFIVYTKIIKLKKIKKDSLLKKNFEIEPNKTTKESFSYSNIKVLEFLDEGNKSLDNKEYANARIVYNKIKRWYNINEDKTKEIYFKILEFYKRIIKEEI